MNDEETTTQVDEVSENLGTPDFSAFIEESPDITQELMHDDKGGNAAVGAGDVTVVMARFLTSFMASRNGEHWKLSEGEANELKHSMDTLIPDLELSPGWAVAAVAVGITAPRILTDFQIQKELDEKEVQQQGGEHGSSKEANA
ncbi:hypothetical protein J8L98_01365 [Pseudoalteromonas sp. MMG013]|uniref:hypothetical protein n=1 Tax=Pseudoalteromonas sp. MMG013 TaxID=2822687 RepID=UPI001B36AEB2|nr:hypothetical protein [Pseudoalteromonas sp. MMG013]MBQ4860338.1 hypothetical protein [Pseudoalteromonas sp. MMG013]